MPTSKRVREGLTQWPNIRESVDRCVHVCVHRTGLRPWIHSVPNSRTRYVRFNQMGVRLCWRFSDHKPNLYRKQQSGTVLHTFSSDRDASPTYAELLSDLNAAIERAQRRRA